MERKFDPTKSYQCRNGLKAEIVARGLTDGLPNAVVLSYSDGRKNLYRYTDDFLWNESSGRIDALDLVNIPEKRKVKVWRGAGNAICVQAAQAFIESVMEILSERHTTR